MDIDIFDIKSLSEDMDTYNTMINKKKQEVSSAPSKNVAQMMMNNKRDSHR